MRVLRKISVICSPPRASPWTVTMQAGWRRGEMVLAGLLGRPCAKAYWLSPGLPADWLEDPAEPVSSPRIATPSCLAGGGAAAPAESYVSRAAHPIQLECVPQSRRLRTGSMLQAPPTAATAATATATPAPPQLRAFKYLTLELTAFSLHARSAMRRRLLYPAAPPMGF